MQTSQNKKTRGAGWTLLKSLWRYDVLRPHTNGEMLHRRTASLGTGDYGALTPGTVMEFKGVISKMCTRQNFYGKMVKKQFWFLLSTDYTDLQPGATFM